MCQRLAHAEAFREGNEVIPAAVQEVDRVPHIPKHFQRLHLRVPVPRRMDERLRHLHGRQKVRQR